MEEESQKEAITTARTSLTRLVLLPGLITLGVTILRLVGELQHWPTVLFNPASGGGGALVGISWLAPVFGINFALKLAKLGNRPKTYPRAIGYAVLGAAALVVFAFVPSIIGIKHSFYDRLLYGWLFFVASALLTLRGWPELFRTLLAYGFAARIPVALLMFFALRGNWGTHYDAIPADIPALGFVAKYLWLGFFPQLTLWVAYTVLAGMLFGSVAAGIARVVEFERGASM